MGNDKCFFSVRLPYLFYEHKFSTLKYVLTYYEFK